MAAKFCTKCRSQVGAFFDKCPYDEAELLPMPEPPTVGQTFADRYEVLDTLGEGGMSIVYKARHKLMDRIVAIKLLKGSLLSQAQALERFRIEAQAVSLLNHPNIVAVHDFGIVDDIQPFLVMDFLDGTTLADVIDAHGHVSPERAVRIFHQVCAGLQHAHHKGIVHRDLKPSNLCLVTDERGKEFVKIVDFGVAKMLNQDAAEQPKLTQAGQVFGSPLYMSPEQCEAKPLDGRSDIYSLGCVMYQALTGVLPINGITTFDTMQKHLTEQPKSFKEVAPQLNIEPNLEAAVFRCLEKKPEDRYHAVEEVLADLPTVSPDSTSLGIKAVEHPLKTRRSFRIFRLGFFALLAVIIVVSIYEATDRGPANDRGTVFQKTIWNSETTLAQSLIDMKAYNLAALVLKAAENQAANDFNNRGPMLTALELQRELYKRSRAFDDFDAVNKKIAVLHEAFVVNEYKGTLDEIEQLDNTSSDRPQEAKLLSELEFQNIVHVTVEMDAFHRDREEETLLKRAKTVYSRILGADSPTIAHLDIILAECYLRQQLFPLARPLLAEAHQIFSTSRGEDDRMTVLATLRLGQIDRDEDRFTEAKTELETALHTVRTRFSNDHKLLKLAVNSYAEYFLQTGDTKTAEKYYAEARSIKEPVEQ